MPGKTGAKKVMGVLAMLVVGALGLLLVINLLPASRDLDYRLDHRFGVTDPQFLRAMDGVFQPPVLQGHRIGTLVNGDEIFPAMLDAIDAAEQTINFETYIYWSGRIATEFAERLSARARDGVAVKVLMDWVGSVPIDEELLDLMRSGGVQVERFRKPRWYKLDRMNNRTHRKLLIVDGRIGFTGGIGIADKWLGNARNPEEWRENHYRIEGPAVAQMQAAFLDNWLESTGELLIADAYFPPLEPLDGGATAQLLKSSPHGGSAEMHLAFMLALSSAERHIRIGAPYFVPDDIAIEQLASAARRGVTVQIIMPNDHIDKGFVRNASRRFWGDLLEAGVLLYEFQPTMYHLKLMVIDESWVTIGSTNFDERSFRLNDEANLNVFDEAFAREQIALFEADLARSQQVTLEAWQNRPWTEKLTDWALSLLRTQL